MKVVTQIKWKSLQFKKEWKHNIWYIFESEYPNQHLCTYSYLSIDSVAPVCLAVWSRPFTNLTSRNLNTAVFLKWNKSINGTAISHSCVKASPERFERNGRWVQFLDNSKFFCFLFIAAFITKELFDIHGKLWI